MLNDEDAWVLGYLAFGEQPVGACPLGSAYAMDRWEEGWRQAEEDERKTFRFCLKCGVWTNKGQQLCGVCA